MLTWHVISLAIVLLELFLSIKFKALFVGMTLIVSTGMGLAFLAMWIVGDEYFASAPILPCFVGFVVLLIKEIRVNRTFATRYNPYCVENKMPRGIRIVVWGVAIVCAIVKLVLIFLGGHI